MCSSILRLEVKRDKLLDFENMSPAPKDIQVLLLGARFGGLYHSTFGLCLLVLLACF